MLSNREFAHNQEVVFVESNEKDKWEIRQADGSLVGPYHTKKEAEEDRQGIKRFYLHEAD